jgi:hypothetical protein
MIGGELLMKTVKECLYDTIHRNKKPLKLIAEEIGVSENYLTRSALPDLEDSETGTGCRFPLKKLIPLIRATGDYSVLDSIEHSLGRFGVLLPHPAGTPTADICRLTMKSIAEFGDLVSNIEKALADNKINQSEKDTIIREGYQAVEAILSLMAACKGKEL